MSKGPEFMVTRLPADFRGEPVEPREVVERGAPPAVIRWDRTAFGTTQTARCVVHPDGSITTTVETIRRGVRQ